ncbi:MAG: hypothetical protein ACE5PO_01360 [Candidatus Bathyarchaeia archaeon]
MVADVAGAEKYTYSSLVSTLLRCEDKLSEFYNTLASQAEREDHRTHFTTLQQKCVERKNAMERIRRETIVELALESISGINLSSFLSGIDRISQSTNKNYLEKAEAAERLTQEVYNQTSAKVASISAEMSDLLSRLARESDLHVEALKRWASAHKT